MLHIEVLKMTVAHLHTQNLATTRQTSKFHWPLVFCADREHSTTHQTLIYTIYAKDCNEGTHYST